MNLLSPNPGLIIWTLITFVLVLLILKKYAWGPLLSALDERENSIREALEQADRARAEAETAAEKNKQALVEAQAEVQAAINKAREDAERIAREVHERAEGEAQQLLEQARRTIVRERDQALQDLRQQTAELAILAAGQLLEENLDDERNRKIVDDFINRIPDAQQN
jgi:F-type H+-transporting ATPase subunit b